MQRQVLRQKFRSVGISVMKQIAIIDHLIADVTFIYNNFKGLSCQLKALPISFNLSQSIRSSISVCHQSGIRDCFQYTFALPEMV